MNLTKQQIDSINSGMGRRTFAKTYGVSEWEARKIIDGFKANPVQPAKAKLVVKKLGEPVKETAKPKIAKQAKPTVTKTAKPKAVKPAPAAKPVCEWLMGNNFINITVDGELFSTTRGSTNYQTIRDALLADDIERAIQLINPKRGIQVYTKGQIEIKSNKLTYKGLVIDNGVTKRIVQSMNTGKPFEFMINFLEKVLQNPSYSAVEELFEFLEHADIEINEDGDIVTFKRVSNTYKDLYTGKMDNSIGAYVSMERNKVNDNRNITCSDGLHVAAKSYIPHYHGGKGRIVICIVNPKDVVSVPTDYNNTKMRVCAYVVQKDITDTFDQY